MQFRILGSLEASDRNGRDLAIGGRKQRALLAMLLLHANRVVPIGRLIGALWENGPPESGRHSVHLLVHRLRRVLGDGQTDAVLRTQGPAYLLQLPPDQLDAEVFERLVGQAQAATAAGEHAKAVGCYDEALALWHGPPLADLHDAPFAQPAIARLEGLHATAAAGRAETALALGQHAEMVPVLGELVHRHPLQERLYRLLILALYRSGRQAEALATYRTAREALVEQLGIEPGEELRRLQQAIVTQNAALAADVAAEPPVPAAPATLAPATPHGRDGQVLGAERRDVTILVAELKTATQPGSDPEDLWAERASLVEPIRQHVERYGGTLGPEVGGTLMAAFGACRTRADDPERAVRAALAICRSLEVPFAAAVRIGIETGDAVVARPPWPATGPEITGEVVHHALTLAARAPAGGVLVSGTAWRDTCHAVEYRPAGIPTARAGAGPDEGAWVAVAPRPPGGEAVGGGATPVIGRERELALLRELLDRLHHVQEPQLVTVIGPSGIGKTRLLQELRDRAERAGERAVWRIGRSLPHGEGVTFWALAEIVRASLGIAAGDRAEEAARQLGDAVERLLDSRPEAARVVGALEALILQPPSDLGGWGGETFVAWRSFFESLGRTHPLVLVLEDLHWADDALLDFVEYLAGHAEAAPLLIVCLAWPELLDRRPGWGGGQRHATTVSLQPLTGEHALLLAEQLLDGPAPSGRRLEQLLSGAGGNPLFVEEYVRVLRDAGGFRHDAGDDLPPPRSVQLLTAARLDGMDPADRELLASAAVLGEVVWVRALAEISGRDPDEVGEALRRVARREFLRRAGRSSIPGEVEYAFRNRLVRDVAYGRLLRGDRAEQHRRAAAWLERLGPDRAGDHAGLIAHHRQQALTAAVALEQPPFEQPPLEQPMGEQPMGDRPARAARATSAGAPGALPVHGLER